MNDVETPEYVTWISARLEALEAHRAALVLAVELAEAVLLDAQAELEAWEVTQKENPPGKTGGHDMEGIRQVLEAHQIQSHREALSPCKTPKG